MLILEGDPIFAAIVFLRDFNCQQLKYIIYKQSSSVIKLSSVVERKFKNTRKGKKKNFYFFPPAGIQLFTSGDIFSIALILQ